MKKFIISFLLIYALLPDGLKAQNYILNPYNLNVTGNPGDFLLSGLTVSNPNPVDITIFINRIEKNIPNGWTSCFCYPTCLAPWLDTLTWTIPAGSSVDISPNFQTTSVPGFGTVRAELWNFTSGSAVDTITFTGSTLSSGMNEIISEFKLYPNPVKNTLFVEHINHQPFNLYIFDSLGKEVFFSDDNSKILSLAQLSNGYYAVRIVQGGRTYESKISVIK